MDVRGTNLGTSPSQASSSDFLLPEMMYTTFAMSCRHTKNATIYPSPLHKFMQYKLNHQLRHWCAAI